MPENLLTVNSVLPILCAHKSKPQQMKITTLNVIFTDLSTFYSSRRQHRACLLKPELPIKNLPTMTTETSLVQYNAICDKAEPFDTNESDSSSAGGSSVTYIENVRDSPNKQLKLTPSELEKYSKEYITVAGREYNVLTVLLNKARDLYMCEKYKDAKSIGRATTRIRN